MGEWNPGERERIGRDGEDGQDNSDGSCRSFVNETVGLGLVLQSFPQVLTFEGEAVLQFVEPSVYRKHLKSTARG